MTSAINTIRIRPVDKSLFAIQKDQLKPELKKNREKFPGRNDFLFRIFQNFFVVEKLKNVENFFWKNFRDHPRKSQTIYKIS